jgi:predicted nucleic acid-binding protein
VKYVVDSNIFVAHVDDKDVHHRRCVPLINRVNSGEISMVGPSLILTEVGAALVRRTGNAELATRACIDLWRHPRMFWVDVTVETAMAAAALAIETGIRGADAIITHIAQLYEVPLLTLDGDIQARAPKSIQILAPENIDDASA